MIGMLDCKLGDVIKFGNGKARPSSEGATPIYGGNGILGHSADANYEGETIVIGRVGAYCGATYYENRPIWVSDNALAAKPKENNNAKYLFYFLKHLDLNQHAQGSSHPLVTQTLLNSINVEIVENPDEQKAIADVLSSLDDKIDLLHRQNKTLEAMAETLFRRWFVEEAHDLHAGKIGDWIENTFGGEWGKEYPEGDCDVPVNCIRGTDIADLQTGLPDKIPLRFVSGKKFEKIKPQSGDIILEISGGTESQSTGRVLYINNDIKSLFSYPLVFSNFCRLLRPLKEEYSFFVFLYLTYLYKQDEFFGLENGSSGIKNLNYKALLFDMAYPMPNAEKVLYFNKVTSFYFKKVNQNKRQIQTLKSLRDTLLPKLMSGEVRVAY